MPATATRPLTTGDDVAWDMIDGHVMAGQIVFVGYSTMLCRRVDGGTCDVHRDRLRRSTYDEVMGAINWFATLGRKAGQS